MVKTKIIIEGITQAGEVFRPHDWAERVSGQLSTFYKHRIFYSPLLQPSVKNGHSCVILDPSLQDANPQLYDSIMEFVRTHQLRICNENFTNSPEDQPADSVN